MMYSGRLHFHSRAVFLFCAVVILTANTNSLSTESTRKIPRNSIKNESNEKTITYNYFAFGSNMASATMTALRNVNPIASTAAILPNHRLAFNVPGTPFIEPSWASVEPYQNPNVGSNKSNGSIVHGVLYKLTEDDFESVCRTEGVPFGYTLHRCRVLPYRGDGCKAGITAFNSAYEDKHIDDSFGVSAFTLRASREEWRNSKDTPPSRSYLNVLIRGAKEFGLDSEYVEMLNDLPTGTTIGGGFAESMLRTAEISKSMRR